MLSVGFRCATPCLWPAPLLRLAVTASRTAASSLVRHQIAISRGAVHQIQHCRPNKRPLHVCKCEMKPEADDGTSWSLSESGARKEWHRADLQLVLVQPCIPQNTGSVARTCAATSVALHLVEPLGFEIDSVKLKRAGLDYWPFVVVQVHKSWEAFLEHFHEQPGPNRLIAFSKLGTTHYAKPGLYQSGDWLMFGAETTGLPKEAHEAAKASGGAVVRIPMVEQHVRSLNLSVSVGVGLYEAIRQLGPEEPVLQ